MKGVLIMGKISVDLYGGTSIFGGRETPLEADIIYCDVSETCSFYKEGKCLKCRRILGASYCPFGSVQTVKGYTSRARKYHSFKEQYTSDEMYNKTDYPYSMRFGVLNDVACFSLGYFRYRKATEGDETNPDVFVNQWGYTRTTHSSANSFIDLADLNVDFLNEILSFVPRAIMGGVISDYKDIVVPDVLMWLKKTLPALHKELLTAYPCYDITPNYVGKKAFVCTMVEGSRLTDSNGNVGVLKGGKIYYDDYKSAFLPCSAKKATLVVEVDDKMVYKVDDNSQCDENTRFD